MENDLAGSVKSIADQIAGLNWPLIMSAVGVIEGMGNQFKKHERVPKNFWLVPMLMGAFVGLIEYMTFSQFSKGVDGMLIPWYWLLTRSLTIYCGWTIIAYYVTIRPLRYAGDWLKRKAAGEGK